MNIVPMHPCSFHPFTTNLYQHELNKYVERYLSEERYQVKPSVTSSNPTRSWSNSAKQFVIVTTADLLAGIRK